MNELLTKDNKPPDLANRVKCDKIKERFLCEVAKLSQEEQAQLWKELQEDGIIKE